MALFENLYVTEHAETIKTIVAEHIDAEIEFVGSRNNIGNRLARSEWGRTKEPDTISLVSAISINEQLSVIRDMEELARRTGLDLLVETSGRLIKTPSSMLLNFLILHEIAHIKHNWNGSRETDCNIWAAQKMPW